MNHVTENELRTVLAERSSGPTRLPHLEEITKRGRRVRLRQRVIAGTALAGAIAAVTAVFGVVLPGLGKESVASHPVTSARVTTGVEMPATVEGSLEQLSLIHSETHRFVGQRVRVTFRPTSGYTGWTIRCADPMDWVLVRSADTAWRWSEFSRCGARDEKKRGLDTQQEETSVSPEWLRAPQNMDIWVFPAGTPIADDGSLHEPYANCKVIDRKQGMCDGKFTVETLHSKPDRIAAVVGRQPGLWSVGIYDKAEGP
ncbi:hypothetical protein [Streptosporangium subroseum]|uniref:hypothetical protein n=1 Tax=Streptosporangium subroseum TaxID=106412 RepID=UPI0030890D1B|nr:hypothetical protein OHB15_44090 [Streptosporangium subroseum]